MSLHRNFGMTVERIDAERVSVGIPDNRGTYHHVELTWENARQLKDLLSSALGHKTYRDLMDQSAEVKRLMEAERDSR